MFAHFGAVLLELIKFGTYSREQMLAAADVEGEDRFRQARRQGRGVLFFTGHFGYWEMQAIAHALSAEPMSVLARPLDNPSLHSMLEDIRTSTGNSVIYRQGAVRRMLQGARRRPRHRRADRSASPHRRDLRRVLPQASRHDVRAGRARASHRRAGDSRVCAAAAARPLPLHLRASRSTRRGPTRRTPSASSRSAAPTSSRCTCAAIPTCGCGCIVAGAIATCRPAPSELDASS